MGDRTERLAIALDDLDRLPDELRIRYTNGRLDVAGGIVKVQLADRCKPVAAVVFSCPLVDAALVCDLIRSYDRSVGDKPAELFINRGTAWARVVFSQVLTVLVGGRATLNPEFFTDVRLAEAPAPSARPLRRGP